DAAGEAFDKVAKLLKLSYPGGPLIEKIAKKGDRNKFKFTRPMINSKDYNFSFSGLKTAVLYEVRGFCNGRDEAVPRLYGNQYKADISASFQQAVIDVLISKTVRAAKKHKVKNVILGGGVSANKELQRQFKNIINEELPNSKYQIPISNLSTDNALMIAIAAYYNIIGGKNIGNWQSVKADANLRLR
ncbi:tRNA (adenosine(37)-N6)-threonylcarbamoyltransferase complex transferase subunit TsaD, partial [Candidatus Parcubacteria bacterium]|nr:tRNA (adenosine(37)-N6)-threonylcarbamoyltransferase complex transferase subunit TsaD [Candidatus Parcubacteria bacterium]